MFTKQYFKRLSIIILMIFIAFVGIVLILDKYYRYSQEKAQRQFVEEMQRPYFEDTYGGKTPEETFDMFLDALKKGDTELASKYFVVEKQEEYRKEFNGNKISNAYIDQWVKARNAWMKGKEMNNNVYFTYEVEVGEDEKVYDPYKKEYFALPKGTYNQSINFVKYPNNIWKITEL